MNTAKHKDEIRQKLLKGRKGLSREEYLERSDKIIANLKAQPEFNEAHIIHCYVSMNQRNEVNTHGLLKFLIKSEKRPVVSITNFDDGTLSHRYLGSFDDLQKNKWGVLEPVRGEDASVKDFDLVIVPMVGGDDEKNRIGYGKGFYDRFLQKVNCPTIGLLFDRCLVPSVPVESFDISLDKCITETKIIT
ncbi:MAG: 5-formyltetrahydrofolate cyclo-ligase [Candidatus Halalkalibacterium sp. M3_1C_030]